MSGKLRSGLSLFETLLSGDKHVKVGSSSSSSDGGGSSSQSRALCVFRSEKCAREKENEREKERE